MNDILSSKRILITGGTGSFGKEMIRRLLKSDCDEIVVFSRDEFKQELLRAEFSGEARITYFIGDIRDFSSVKRALYGINYVFHAAALKQVPSCEFYPFEAVKTNIIGSQNVIEASIENNVSRLVCLSTDKAVQPVNAMGMSKALMEKLAQSRGRSTKGTIISCVRYGNVIYSRGSVIPLFISQIHQGKPLTITNPNMTRFLMNLSEATDLVIEAFENAEGGDIFIKKAPAADIHNLALAIQRITNTDTGIQVIGERHSEKLYEVLASSQELQRSQDRGEYLRLSADNRRLDYTNQSEDNFTDNNIDDYTSHNTKQLNQDELEKVLLAIPEIQSSLSKTAPI